MVNDKELAAIIARDIFSAFDLPSRKCQRIQGKHGQYPNEGDLGGFCETALADHIERCLAEHRSY